MASETITIARAELTDDVSRALIESLNAELSGAYSEPGATHFSLDPDEVAGGRGAFLIVYHEGTPVGCGALRLLDAGTAELKRMYVSPSVRGRGLGRRLVAALEAEARALGVRRLVLETGIRQAAALALYHATGFRPIPLYGEYCLSPDTSICLGKELVVEDPGEKITVVEADLSHSDHQEATVQLLNAYAMDSMGDGKPLSETARRDLIPGLRQHPTTMVFLAYSGAEAVGLAICFLGFSTFAARPLVNIHDYFVVPAHRRSGVGRLLLEAIERRAREIGCCRITLEVQEKNHRARMVYAAAGFAQALYVPEAGGVLFLHRPL